jgi:hypothetical protein
MLRLGETALLGIMAGGPIKVAPERAGLLTNSFAVRVHGLHAIVADLAARGVRFLPEELIGGHRTSTFLDPEQNAFSLIEISEASSVFAEEAEALARWSKSHA